ncbi:MAG: sugar ABC transporter substrate-binding protein [Chloroflexi bacterium]|nr:sugar ABC transporter substrate-binding protein [Chloroflexota bacterium]
MQKSRLFVLLSALLVMAFVVGACAVPAAQAPAASTSGGQAASAANPVTLTWAVWGSPEEVASHQAVADVFTKEHPEIKIEIWSQPWNDYFTKIKTLWASGDAKSIPDVAFLWPTPSYAAQGVLENLDPYIEKSGYKIDDYWPGLLESAKFDGHVYGFPRDIDVGVLYYNKDIFKEAGVDLPTDKWTWDDLLAAAEKLTKKDANGKVTRYALAMEGGKYDKWVNQNGGALLDDMRNPSKCTMADQPAMDAIKFFTGMMDKGYAMRDADLSAAGGDQAVFQSGQAAMIIQNTSRVSAFNAAKMNYDVQVVPIPKGGKRFNAAGGAAWVMSAGSDNKDAAWTFISWLQSTGGGEKVYTDRGEIFPALQSTANEDFLKQDQPPTNRQAVVTEASASGVGGFGYFPDWDELNSSIMSPATSKLWSGEGKPEDILPEMCKQVDQFLKDKGYPKS